MLPTSSSTDLVGVNVRSATALINWFSFLPKAARPQSRSKRRTAYATVRSKTNWQPVRGRRGRRGDPGGRGMFTPALSWRSRSCGIIAGVGASGLLAACGSGASQATNEPHGDFPVRVSVASFPAAQRLAQREHLVIAVRNTGQRTLPDVAVTICNVSCAYPAPPGEGTSAGAFATTIAGTDLANPSRPIWIVQRNPGPCGFSCRNGGEGAAATAYSNTWALGPLKAGRTARFDWAVTPVSAGRHVVAWEVAAGLNGNARAVVAGGGRPHGTFAVHVSSAPARTHVGPNGQVTTSQ